MPNHSSLFWVFFILKNKNDIFVVNFPFLEVIETIYFVHIFCAWPGFKCKQTSSYGSGISRVYHLSTHKITDKCLRFLSLYSWLTVNDVPLPINFIGLPKDDHHSIKSILKQKPLVVTQTIALLQGRVYRRRTSLGLYWRFFPGK